MVVDDRQGCILSALEEESPAEEEEKKKKSRKKIPMSLTPELLKIEEKTMAPLQERRMSAVRVALMMKRTLKKTKKKKKKN